MAHMFHTDNQLSQNSSAGTLSAAERGGGMWGGAADHSVDADDVSALSG